MSKLLSFVIPCYRSEKTIERVIDEIRSIVSEKPNEYDYEIICVNDCSPDDVYSVLKQLAVCDKKIKLINFVKNMGKHAAVLAGYAVIRGDYVVNLDDDYQSPTFALWEFLEKVENDQCDIAMAHYYVKKESKFKVFGSDINKFMTNIMLDKPKNVRYENFSVMKAFVAEEMIKYKRPYPFLEGLMFRVTNRVMSVDVDQRERGDDLPTGFTFKKSLQLWLNGLTAFSVKPLRIASVTGAILAGIGFIWGIAIIIQKILGIVYVLGFSTIAAIQLFTSGVFMLMLGLIGEYIGRIYICINDSPQYIIRETVNLDEKE